MAHLGGRPKGVPAVAAEGVPERHAEAQPAAAAGRRDGAAIDRESPWASEPPGSVQADRMSGAVLQEGWHQG